jgi:hypothetical protein
VKTVRFAGEFARATIRSAPIPDQGGTVESSFEGAKLDCMRETSNWRSLWREMAVDARKQSIGGYLLIGSLVSLLAGVIVFGGLAWSLGEGTDVPAFGYVAMAAGVLFSLVLGIGLMALCLCRSRFGYDEPNEIVRSDNREHLPEDTRL